MEEDEEKGGWEAFDFARDDDDLRIKTTQLCQVLIAVKAPVPS